MTGLGEFGDLNDPAAVRAALAKIKTWSKTQNAGGIAIKETAALPYKNVQSALEGMQAAIDGMQAATLGICSVCHNAKLVASRSGNAETWALKTLAGADPSDDDPVIWVGVNGTRLPVTSAVSLTASSGSTLGMTSGLASNLHFALANDDGTFRLVVRNASDASSWSRFPPSGLLSSSAEGGAGGADSAKVNYANTSLASKEYAHLGFMTYTLATAGTWNTAPSMSAFGPNAPKPGDILQGVSASNSGTVTVSSTTYVAMANKNIAISPRMAGSIIRLQGSISVIRSGASELSYGLWHRGTTNNVGSFGAMAWGQGDGTSIRDTLIPFGYDKPGVTTSQTYTLQGRRQFGTSTDFVFYYATAEEIMG